MDPSQPYFLPLVLGLTLLLASRINRESSSRIPRAVQTIALALLVYAIIRLILRGYSLPWTGFGELPIDSTKAAPKTLWDWLDLLGVPLVILVLGVAFQQTYDRAQRRSEDERHYEDILQTYTERLSDELLERLNAARSAKRTETKATESYEHVRQVIEASTLSAFRQLDPKRKAIVLQFLQSLELIQTPKPVISLAGADLRGIGLLHFDLRNSCLANVDMSDASMQSDRSVRELSFLARPRLQRAGRWFNANLDGADLHGACLSGADLHSCSFQGAVLDGASMTGVNLENAVLSQAKLRGVHLSQANLRHSVFKEADLTGATFSWVGQARHPRILRWWEWFALVLVSPIILFIDWEVGARYHFLPARIEDTDFTGADLSGAFMTPGQIKAASKHAPGATLPDGTQVPQAPSSPAK